MILKLDMKHQAMELFKDCINDPGMTLTCFTTGSTWAANAFEWGKSEKCDQMGGKLAGNMQMDGNFMFMKKFCPKGVVCPCPSAINTYL